jgi:iron complex transport system substrate-binding protein
LENLVGRSHECDYPPAVEALPVCTRPRIAIDADSREIDRQVRDSARAAVSIYEVFDDVIERLRPTHILTQIQCEVCAVSLRDVEQAIERGMKGQPKIVSLRPDSLADIWEDFRRVARALEIPQQGELVIAGLKRRMAGLCPAPRPHRPAPRVACIEWIEPLMAAGNWTPELIAMAGGVDLFGESGRHNQVDDAAVARFQADAYDGCRLAASRRPAADGPGHSPGVPREMTFEQLASADPDVLVIAPCGFDLRRTEREIHWLTSRPGWSHLRAVRGGRVCLADGNQYFNRPGPRVVETLEALVEMLHPQERPPRLRGEAWRVMMSM